MRRLAALVAFALPFIAPTFARADCPPSQICPFSMCSSSTVPMRNQFGSCPGGYGGAGGGYDLPQGNVHASAENSGGCGSYGTVTAVDNFTIIGLPTGTPVHFVAKLHVTMSGSSDPSDYPASAASGSLTDVDSYQTVSVSGDAQATGMFNLDETAQMTLDHLAGQPFQLHYDANVGTAYSYASDASVQGILQFDLPAGVAIVSCQGYATDKSLPAQSTSWGRVKTLYR